MKKFFSEEELGWPIPGGFMAPTFSNWFCVVCGAHVNEPHLKHRFACKNITCKIDVLMEPRIRESEASRLSKCKNQGFSRGLKAVSREEYLAFKKKSEDVSKRISNARLNSLKVKRVDMTLLGDLLTLESEIIHLHFDSASWYINNEWINEDIRASGDTYGRDISVWSSNSRVACALKAIGGQPAISIACRVFESPSDIFVRELCHGNRELLDALDYFMVWRCGCPNAHEVRYRTLEDLPHGYGYHDACPHCNHAPIEVHQIHEKEVTKWQ